MSNPSNEAASELLRELASIQKSIGELSVAAMATHAALNALLPAFEDQYVAQLAGERILREKQQYEHRIGILLERADRMSKS